MPSPAVHQRELRVDQLELDPENPRVIVEEGASQETLLEYLYFREALDELVTSFVESGYFVEEPLVAVKAGSKYRVVEGNRRLATLKLLLDPGMRRKVGVSGWPSLTAAQRGRLERVPVVVYPHRADVMAFLGYRHITGAKKWAPFQKSRFVAQLVDAGEDLAHIEDLIGDSTQAVKKLYQEYIVFEQIRRELDVDPGPIVARFSLLEVTLGQRPIKKYLGISTALPKKQTDRVVPDDHLDNLSDVVGWVFGTAERAAAITESRDINQKLAKVVGNPEALSRLKETNDLELAYDITDGEQQSLLRSLGRAENAIRRASQSLPLHKDSLDIQAAVERVATLAAALRKQLK